MPVVVVIHSRRSYLSTCHSTVPSILFAFLRKPSTAATIKSILGSPKQLPLTSIPLEQHHHDDAGKQQVLLVFGEINELLNAEAALQDGGLLLYAQHVPAIHLRQVGRVEEEAAQGVAQG